MQSTARMQAWDATGQLHNRELYFTIEFEGLHLRAHGLFKGCRFLGAPQEIFHFEDALCCAL